MPTDQAKMPATNETRTRGARASLIPARWVAWRERLRGSIWVTPLLFILAALLLQPLISSVDEATRFDPDFAVDYVSSAAVAQQLASTMAGAMLTFLGVVFSLSILALQMTSGQFSPRVMRTFVRARSTKLALGIFLATFVFALATMSEIETGGPEGSDYTPVLTVAVLFLLVLSSLFVFLAFVNTIVRLIRVSYLVETVARETHRALATLPSETTPVDRPTFGSTPVIVTHEGRAGALSGIHVRRLVQLADRADVVIEVRARIGDFLAHGAPIVAVHRPPASAESDEHTVNQAAIQRCFMVSTERSMYLDPAFGLRQLVDIASKALSPAVNDPTTATQCIDHIVDLLVAIGLRPDATGIVLGRDDRARVTLATRDWATFVQLGFSEIRRYGHDAPQIARRLESAFDDLESALPVQRHAAIDEQRKLLHADIAASRVVSQGDRSLYLTADRGGLG